MNKTAIYLRLSDEDRNKINKFELSESIQNQKRMLIDYANKKGFKIVGIYNDEDYSGIDSNRPEFNKMLKECQKGNIDIVLCKTQSRFSRDMELIEKYLHNKFIEWNVRFISLVDGADTDNKCNKKQRQINGLINEWYLEDTSLNIRETLKNKRENGLFTSAFAPYGYIKDPKNKNHLIIDKNVSNIIIKIFSLYNEGLSISKIQTYLNNNNILSPLEYKIKSGSKLKIPSLKNINNNICTCGYYIIINSFYNNKNKIINNFYSNDYLTNSNLNNNIEIKVNYISNNCKLFYFFNNEYYPIKINDIIPNNYKYIKCVCSSLDRLHEVKYKLEVKIKKNTDKLHFNYITNIFSDNINEHLSFNTIIRKKFLWSEQSIKKILHDEVYIGNLNQGKTSYVSYKNRKIIYKNKENWIKVKNTHDKIINDKLWVSVNNKLTQNKKCMKNGNTHILVNKVFCENCNRVFYKCGKNDDDFFSYLACKDKVNKFNNCDNKKYVNERQLHKLIINDLNTILEESFDKDILLNLFKEYISKDIFKEKLNCLNFEKNKISDEKNNKLTYFKDLYEDRLKGFITDEEYLFIKDKLDNDILFLNERINTIDKKINKINNQKINLYKQKDLFKKYVKITTLDKNIANNFIDKIYINKIDNDYNRIIKINYNLNRN